MGAPVTDYATWYRWQWFSRAVWREDFRRQKRHSSLAFAELMAERGGRTSPVLDSSCGLGLKTIVMKEAGLKVEGSDGCETAVRLAKEFAREESIDRICYFVSTWKDLPKRTPTRYAAVFNDALSWTDDDREMAASLRGLHDVLAPGGALVYMGATPGTPPREGLLEEEWRKYTVDGTCRLGWHCQDASCGVTEMVVAEKGPDYVDRHHLYLVEEQDRRRLEVATMRHLCKWHWPRIEPFLRGAGFRRFGTKEFTGADGRPASLVVAERGQ